MISKNNFFYKYNFNSRKFNNNLKKTKKVFSNIKLELKNFNMPILSSYDKNYVFSFSKNTIKKFNKYNNIIIIGMGGSILGIKCIHSFFRKKIKKEVFFFDNLDSNLYLKFKKIKNLKNSCFIIVSKSGNTLETLVNLSMIFSKSLFKNKSVFITELKNNSLVQIAKKYNAEIIEHKEFIGGRYSVLSESAMFPAKLMGLHLHKFKNLNKLINNRKFVTCLIRNVASIYTLNTKGINNSVMLNYDSRLNDLSFWYQQLVGESLGKKGKGINPIASFGPKDHHSLLQLYLDGPKNKFFTFFNSANKENTHKLKNEIIPNSMKFIKGKNLKSIINAQLNSVKNIFIAKKIPFREVFFKKNNEEELGLIFTFFVLETILLARLMNVDAFNQPSVDQVKIETKKILS